MGNSEIDQMIDHQPWPKATNDAHFIVFHLLQATLIIIFFDFSRNQMRVDRVAIYYSPGRHIIAIEILRAIQVDEFNLLADGPFHLNKK